MGFGELLVLAVGLSMDAFAVSVCKGLALGRSDRKTMCTCGIWFGAFQALMPLAGFWMGSVFADAIEAIDHWVAFGLLGIIGVNMIHEAFADEASEESEDGDLSPKTMFILAIATSIDALAVGISLAMAGNVNIWAAVALIGTTTFLLSGAGVKVGSVFGNRYQKKAQIAGGVMLILLGLQILLEHLGVIT